MMINYAKIIVEKLKLKVRLDINVIKKVSIDA